MIKSNFYFTWQRNKSFCKKYKDTHIHKKICSNMLRIYLIIYSIVIRAQITKSKRDSCSWVILALFFSLKHHHYTWCCHLETIKQIETFFYCRLKFLFYYYKKKLQVYQYH